MKSKSEIRAEWLAELLSTSAADRPGAESALRRLFAAAGFAEPQHFVWYDSPFAASWAVALLAAPYHFLWARTLESPSLSRTDRQQLDHARASLGERLGLADWHQVSAAVGAPIGMHLQMPPALSRMMRFVEARLGLTNDPAALFGQRSNDNELQRAEDHFWGSNRGALRSALHCPTTDAIIGQSFAADYSFSTMADDEHRVADREPPAIMRAAWDVARSAGMWWGFENAVILSERPAALSVNDQRLLHRDDGPAVLYRDGWRVYAWNGKAVPEKWILQPDDVAPREYRGFDPTFKQWVDSRSKPAGKAAPKRGKAGPLLLDRYLAGAYRDVWQELVALGPSVRERPHAADALAVARETMRRVDANVRTVVQRLSAMGYAFGPSRAHAPPNADAQKRIAKVEKQVGPLPLSLRAFYEVVGEVNLIGVHARLAPADGAIAVDPLVVYGIDNVLAALDDDTDADSQAVPIAPDDLHKADTSGGDPYEVAVPEPRADGELLNERHHLLFVDYLRLCFRFGGFPGYDGVAEVPSEVVELGKGLLEF